MNRILLCDSSAVVLSIEKQILASSSLLEYGGEAKNYAELKILLSQKKFDGIAIDSKIIQEGLNTKNERAVIDECLSFKIPVLLFTSGNEMKRASDGISVMEKPSFFSMNEASMKKMSISVEKIFQEAKHKQLFKNCIAPSSKPEIIVEKKLGKVEAVLIGVSTGGPATLRKLLTELGGRFDVPVLITQHVDSNFDKQLIDWLNKETLLTVKMAEEGDVPVKNTVYFAPADYHLIIKKNGMGQKYIHLDHGREVNFLRPAIDCMFESAADVYENNCVAVLLTGMGSDGAKGCCKIKKKGGYTITEAEETCAVYGMPKAAFEAGGSCEVLPLYKIGNRLKELVRGIL